MKFKIVWSKARRVWDVQVHIGISYTTLLYGFYDVEAAREALEREVQEVEIIK
jgi:hypothetical protein